VFIGAAKLRDGGATFVPAKPSVSPIPSFAPSRWTGPVP